MATPQKPKSKNPVGKPADPRITELSRQLGVSRQRAGTLLKEGKSLGDIATLRAEMLSLQIERMQIELAAIREGGESKVIIEKAELKKAIRMLKYFIQTGIDKQAEQVAVYTASMNLQERIEAWKGIADSAFFAGIGSMFGNSMLPMKEVLSELLAEGGSRHRAGADWEADCRHDAIAVYQNLIADRKEKTK